MLDLHAGSVPEQQWVAGLLACVSGSQAEAEGRDTHRKTHPGGGTGWCRQ